MKGSQKVSLYDTHVATKGPTLIVGTVSIWQLSDSHLFQH
jgi:hypothetical protein